MVFLVKIGFVGFLFLTLFFGVGTSPPKHNKQYHKKTSTKIITIQVVNIMHLTQSL